MRKNLAIENLEREHGKPIRDIVRDAYKDHGSIQRAAESLGMHPATYYGWMVRLRIQIKKTAVVA